MRDGIEVHFDEKRGHLELACEPDAFAPYRDIARQQLADMPGLRIDKVVELNIIDTATFVARRNAPRKRIFDILFCLLVFVILGLAIIGASTLLRTLMRSE